MAHMVSVCGNGVPLVKADQLFFGVALHGGLCLDDMQLCAPPICSCQAMSNVPDFTLSKAPPALGSSWSIVRRVLVAAQQLHMHACLALSVMHLVRQQQGLPLGATWGTLPRHPCRHANVQRACWAQSQEDYLALTRAGVGVSLDGRRVTAPPGVVDADGFANLTSRIKKRA